MHSMITRSMSRLGLEERPFAAVVPRQRRRPVLIRRSLVNPHESPNVSSTKRGAKCLIPFGNPKAPKKRRRRVNHRWSQRPPAVPEWEYDWPAENVLNGRRPRVSEDAILGSIDALIEWARDWKLEDPNQSDSRNTPPLSEQSEFSDEPQPHEEIDNSASVSPSGDSSSSFSFTYNGENSNLLEMVRPARFSDEPGGLEPVVVIKLSQIDNLSTIFGTSWRDSDLLNRSSYPILDLRSQNPHSYLVIDNNENCENRDAKDGDNLSVSDTFVSAQSSTHDSTSTVDNVNGDDSITGDNLDDNESNQNDHSTPSPQKQLRDDEQEPTTSQATLNTSVSVESKNSDLLQTAATITMEDLNIILEDLSKQVATATTEQNGNQSPTERDTQHETVSNETNSQFNAADKDLQTVSTGNLNQPEASQLAGSSNMHKPIPSSSRALTLIRTQIVRQPLQQCQSKQNQLASRSSNRMPPVANFMPPPPQFPRVKIRHNHDVSPNILCLSSPTMLQEPWRRQVSDYALTEPFRRAENKIPTLLLPQPSSSSRSLLSPPGRNLVGLPPKRKENISFLQGLKETVAAVSGRFHPGYVRELGHITNVWGWWADVAARYSRASNVSKEATASLPISSNNGIDIAENENIITNSGQAENVQMAQNNFLFITANSVPATPLRYLSNQITSIPPTRQLKHYSNRPSRSPRPRARTPKYVRKSGAYQHQKTVAKVPYEISISTTTASDQPATSAQTRNVSVSPPLVAQFSPYPVQISENVEPMDCAMSFSEPNYCVGEPTEAMHTNQLGDMISLNVNNELMECDQEKHNENNEGHAMDIDEEWMEFQDAS